MLLIRTILLLVNPQAKPCDLNTVIIIIILLFCEFFTPTLADGFLLMLEWQQVFKSSGDLSVF